MAVDVGSTTIAAHLCDLTSGEVLASAGVMNPQIRYGEDLMSRVSYIMMNAGGEVDLISAPCEKRSMTSSPKSRRRRCVETTDIRRNDNRR